MSVLAVGGYAESGKDAFVDGLEELCGYERTFMSKPLMNALLTLDPLISLTILNNRISMGPGPVRYSQLHEAVGYADSKKEPEVRRLLQILGTEVGRRMFGENVWISLIIEELRSKPDAFWGVTGIRYSNELDALREEHACSIWIHRPGVVPINTHSSDNSLGPEDFDYQLHNDGSLADLKEKAREFHQSLISRS